MTITNSAEEMYQTYIGKELEDMQEKNPSLCKLVKMSYYSGMLTTYLVASELRSAHSSDAAEVKLRKLKAEIMAFLRTENEAQLKAAQAPK